MSQRPGHQKIIITKIGTINNHTIPVYQKLCGTKCSSLKSGCGCFVKEGLNFKERIDLRVKFINDQNEFQSCWIEMIKETIYSNWGLRHRHAKKNSWGILKKLNDTLNKVKKRNKHCDMW